jgi:diaminopimelate epimerase
MPDISFAKYHATGNDFIVLSAAALSFDRRGRAAASRWLAAFARAILARHTGVGADGLLVLWPPKDRKHHAAMQIFNADGSEAEISGNGIRCAAAWLLDRARNQFVFEPDSPRLGTASSLTDSLEIETAAGLKTAGSVDAPRGETVFRVAMGAPRFEPEKIPFRAAGASAPVVRYPLPTSLGPKEVTLVSMGNPHCSLFVSGFDELDWRALGREIESHPLFPNRTNVEFVRVISPREIEVRFWERGVGETASSGTGSSAALVASALNGLAEPKAHVRTPGGDLKVEWKKSTGVFLTGPVRRVASGIYAYEEVLGARALARSSSRRAAAPRPPHRRPHR